ncbi:LysR family transcriptional regulator [Microvirga antarctica]|uniref:LysR family transcriptional regulator n=1 Tax=Microvirga antarctica TaxID=2819233 RepID=UPI001B307871|nr:LysR family transcriptional regulator [Microvirga antarctica]
MNSRFLRTFCVLAETGSFAAAARHLGLTASAVRDQVKVLEEDLGARLIVRAGRSVSLTPEALALVGPARDILVRIDDLRQVAQLDRLQGVLKVGAISTAMISLFPVAFGRMSQHFDSVELKAVPGTSAHLYDLVERRELDCALIVRPPYAMPKSLVWQKLRREPLVLVSRAGDARTSVDTILRSDPFIRVDRKAWTGRFVSSYLRDRRIEIPDLVELDALEAIVMLVESGLGVALLPDWGIHEADGIRKLPIADARYSREVGLLRRLGSPHDRLVEALSSALNEAAGR